MSDIVQVNFRMPKDLKDKLEQAAETNGRSITSELVIRLEQSFNYVPDIGEFNLTIEQLEHITAKAGKAYLLTIADLIKDLPEEEGNRQLRNLITQLSDE